MAAADAAAGFLPGAMMMMRVEGYLQWASPLWMWEDAVGERMVGVQEYWLRRQYLVATRNDEPHYGVIFSDWPKLARLVTYAKGPFFIFGRY